MDGASVQGSAVSTGPKTAVLGNEMKGGRPWNLGASGYTVLQHGDELGIGHGQAFRTKAVWVAGYWRARCCANVVCGVPQLTIAPCRFLQVWEFL